MNISQVRPEEATRKTRKGDALARRGRIGRWGAVFAALILLAAGGAVPLSASAATISAVNQCNGLDNAGGLAINCEVTVTNYLNVATGVDSATVTVKECHGAANAGLTCTSSTTPSTTLVLTVTQCNGSGSGGGGTVTCTVHVINRITGSASRTSATVNQCIETGQGGGTEPTILCSPLGSTSGATVTQCNGSGNGGGGTLRVKCTVTPSTETAALRVTIDQCNGSGNGGGAVVICTASETNTILTGAGPGGGSGSASRSLAHTGVDTGPILPLTLLTILMGALLVAVSRRHAHLPRG